MVNIKRCGCVIAACVLASSVVLSACDTSSSQPAEISEDDLVRFVPAPYTPLTDMDITGEADGYVFKNKVSFGKDNKITADLDMSLGEDSYSDHFVYKCTDEEIDRMQVIYQSVTDVKHMDDKEYRDEVYVGLSYVLGCFSQVAHIDDTAALTEADDMLVKLYDRAVGNEDTEFTEDAE